MSQHDLDRFHGDEIDRLLGGQEVADGPGSRAIGLDDEHHGQPLLGIAIAVALSLPVWGVIAALWFMY